MTAIKHNQNSKQRRNLRTHRRVIATQERPKLLITRSNQAIYLQVIDENGQVITALSDLALIKQKKLDNKLNKTAKAAETGKVLAQELKKKKIKALAVDRGANQYHGRIKAAVEAIKETGIEA